MHKLNYNCLLPRKNTLLWHFAMQFFVFSRLLSKEHFHLFYFRQPLLLPHVNEKPATATAKKGEFVCIVFFFLVRNEKKGETDDDDM